MPSVATQAAAVLEPGVSCQLSVVSCKMRVPATARAWGSTVAKDVIL